MATKHDKKCLIWKSAFQITSRPHHRVQARAYKHFKLVPGVGAKKQDYVNVDEVKI
jgi:hypothetical protein